MALLVNVERVQRTDRVRWLRFLVIFGSDEFDVTRHFFPHLIMFTEVSNT